jgi:hypothetical protein
MPTPINLVCVGYFRCRAGQRSIVGMAGIFWQQVTQVSEPPTAHLKEQDLARRSETPLATGNFLADLPAQALD